MVCFAPELSKLYQAENIFNRSVLFLRICAGRGSFDGAVGCSLVPLGKEKGWALSPAFEREIVCFYYAFDRLWRR